MSMIGNLLRVSSRELEDYIRNSILLEEKIDSENKAGLLDIDKTWEGIFFILTSCDLASLDEAKTPLKWVIFGDYTLDENQDMGYGPADYRTSEQVKEVSKAIEIISDDDFKKMFHDSGIVTRTDIYPGVSGSEQNEAFEYYFEHFKLIKEFYSEASKNNEAVISFVY